MFSIMTIASSTTKPGRDGERHERQVVEAVADQYITPNVPMSESGTATPGISGRAEVAQEEEDDEHDEDDRDDERLLDVLDRRAHGLGAVAEIV